MLQPQVTKNILYNFVTFKEAAAAFHQRLKKTKREKKVVETNFFVLFLASQKLVSESCKFALRSKKERLFQTKLCWVQMIVVLTGS